jgi:hypothetical protein
MGTPLRRDCFQDPASHTGIWQQITATKHCSVVSKNGEIAAEKNKNIVVDQAMHAYTIFVKIKLSLLHSEVFTRKKYDTRTAWKKPWLRFSLL